MAASRDKIRSQVDANPLWYHTLELPHGVTTPGWFDLRPIVGRLPWPDVRGKRCLDVGTYDGYLAFELERRGAREVVATDISDHASWDWPPDMEACGPQAIAEIAGPEKGAGFRIASGLLGSTVQRLEMSVYDLGPERVGTFDVVVCGSLLLHLRDPLKALSAIRSVCAGSFLSAEEVGLTLALRNGRRPVAELNGSGPLCQWWVPSPAGHRRMLYAAGFDVQRATRPYCVAFGPAHAPRRGIKAVRDALTQRLLTGSNGVPHAAALATPRI